MERGIYILQSSLKIETEEIDKYFSISWKLNSFKTIS